MGKIKECKYVNTVFMYEFLKNVNILKCHGEPSCTKDVSQHNGDNRQRITDGIMLKREAFKAFPLKLRGTKNASILQVF